MKKRSLTPRGHVSLERALSKLGIASRTQAREWIEAGRVRVNGVVRKHPGFKVVPERAHIEIDGVRRERSEFRAFILHKPRGVVTTRSDEKDRPTVFSLLSELGPLGQDAQYCVAVGRLDLATSGLLIFTNDTQLANALADPANAIPRVYIVEVRGEVDELALERLRAGVTVEGERLCPSRVELQKASGRESRLLVELREGKNREIRRLFEAVGHAVTRLKRISYGGLQLGDLPVGKIRELSREEILRAFPGLMSRP